MFFIGGDSQPPGHLVALAGRHIAVAVLECVWLLLRVREDVARAHEVQWRTSPARQRSDLMTLESPGWNSNPKQVEYPKSTERG